MKEKKVADSKTTMTELATVVEVNCIIMETVTIVAN